MISFIKIYIMRLKRLQEESVYEKGAIYGRLTLTGKSYMIPMYGQLRRIVEADCICGTTRMYTFGHLRSGDTKSCGCLRREVTGERATTHGLSQHPLYEVYGAILKRCYVPQTEGYENYGGRGITVCEEWQEDFMNFYNWCVENGYQSGLSIDRIENDGNYGPNNCRFVTRKIQSRNNRRNKMITAFGETKCLFDWGKDGRCKIGVWGLRSRYDRGEYTDMEEMITAPKEKRKDVSRNMKSNKLISAFGETKTQSEWLEDERCVVKVDGLRDRLRMGWEPEKALSSPAKINQFNKPVIESARQS